MSRNTVLKWLQNAVNNPKSSVTFGANAWENMHGGGTSKFPHCRPVGLYNTKTKQYNVKLFYVPNIDKPRQVLIDAFSISGKDGGEPTKNEVYEMLIKKVEDEVPE